MKDFKFLGSNDTKTYGNFNDISYDSNGEVALVESTAKLRQDMAKILLTDIGEHKVFQGYGSDLQSLINANVKSDTIKKQIVNSITYAFSYLNQINQSADLNEKIDTINSIDVRYAANDPRAIYIRIQATSGTNETITLTFGG